MTEVATRSHDMPPPTKRRKGNYGTVVANILDQPPTPEEVWMKAWKDESEQALQLRFIRLKHQQAMVRRLIRNKPLVARQRELRKKLRKRMCRALRIRVQQTRLLEKCRASLRQLQEIQKELEYPNVREGQKRRRELRLRFIRGQDPLEERLKKMESALLDKTKLLDDTSSMLGLVAKKLNLDAAAFQSVETLKKSWPVVEPHSQPKKTWSPADYRLSKGVRQQTKCYHEECDEPIQKAEYRIRMPNLRNKYSYFSYHLRCFFRSLSAHHDWVPLERMDEIEGWDNKAIPPRTRKEIQEYFDAYTEGTRRWEQDEESEDEELSQPASPLPTELPPLPLSRQAPRDLQDEDPEETPSEEAQRDPPPPPKSHESLPVPVSHFV